MRPNREGVEEGGHRQSSDPLWRGDGLCLESLDEPGRVGARRPWRGGRRANESLYDIVNERTSRSKIVTGNVRERV